MRTQFGQNFYNTAKPLISWPLKNKENAASVAIPAITFFVTQMLTSFRVSLVLSAFTLGAYKIYSMSKGGQKNQTKPNASQARLLRDIQRFSPKQLKHPK